MNLVEKFAERVQPGDDRQDIRDDVDRGLGLRVESIARGGRKSFFWEARIGGRRIFRAIGPWPRYTVKMARDKARELDGQAAAWKNSGFLPEADPFAKARKVVPKLTSVPTFKELAEEYIRTVLLNPDPEIGALNKERAEYELRLILNNHLAKLLDQPIDTITTNDVLAARNATTGRHMQNSIVEVVRRLYRWSCDSTDGQVNFWKVPENPAASIALNSRKPRERFLQEHELARFWSELAKESTPVDLHDFLILAISTGARKSNIFAMRWQDISLDRQDWFVPMSKNGSSYHVFLLDDAVKVLERRRRNREEGEIYVFPSRSKSSHMVDIKKEWYAFRKRCGFPDVRIHDLRRTVGSWLAINGTSQTQIADALGHKSLAATEIYARLNQTVVAQARKAAAEKMREAASEAVKREKRERKRSKAVANAGR